MTERRYRLAVLSDVHGDVHALGDALDAIHAAGCDAIVCAGDLVDYGLFPDETLALLAERGIPCVRGNHDRWVVENKSDGGWDLSPASCRFLSALPESWNAAIEGVRVAVHHASPRGDMDGIYPDQADDALLAAMLSAANADVLIVGHTHWPFRRELPDGRVIANPGALLRAPAEGATNPPATGTFGVLELPSRAFTVQEAKGGAEVLILRGRPLRVFLDDQRTAPDDWTPARWPEDVIALLQTGDVVELSLDHDLGDADERRTGYDVLLWIEEAVATRGFRPPKITIHSANAGARQRMILAVESIERYARRRRDA